MSPYFTVRGGEYDPKMRNIRIDGASGIYEGDNFRRLVPWYQPRDRNTRNRTDLPMRPKATGNQTALETCQDMYRPHLVPLPLPLLDLCLKVVPLLLPTGSSTRKVPSVRHVMNSMEKTTGKK